MPDMKQESWKGHAIDIRTIPVRHLVTRNSPTDSFIAIIRIERDRQVLADWHVPKFSERWATEREAYNAAFEYAVKLIDRGILGDAGHAAAPTVHGNRSFDTHSVTAKRRTS
jgi:hypothetical protein